MREGRPRTVMCAYPRLNGVFCSDNRWLLTKVLREEWGFDGLVMTDWGGLNDRVAAFRAGCDLSMPGGGRYGERAALKAIKANTLSESAVEACADRLLDFVYVEFMRGLQKGFLPKQCANCGRWFLQKPGATYHYCDQPAPGQGDKTCREIGASISFQDKVRNNEIWRLHQRAYKKYFARTRKGTMGRREFETWAREAEQLRDQALAEYARAEAAEAKSGIVTELEQALNKI